jgi:predicted dehydrogenase
VSSISTSSSPADDAGAAAARVGIPRVILAGVRGFGEHHRANLRRLQGAGKARLVACVDPVVARELDSVDGAPIFDTLDAALEHAGGAEVVIVATPIGVHFALASAALRAGADVLLEKPPVPTMADFEELLRLEAETGHVVQVGFQSLGSHAIAAFENNEFGIGARRAINARGLWLRRAAYWNRARWAGKRSLDGHPVVDGVATNPLAHAIATALRIAGLRRAESVANVETELYRAAAIDADDTSVVRITGVDGCVVTAALTLAAPEQRDPLVTVVGGDVTASFSYTTDEVIVASTNGRGAVDGSGAVEGLEPVDNPVGDPARAVDNSVGRPVETTRTFGRDDLVENLLDHRSQGTPLIVPLVETGAFMRVLEAIRLADEPTRIDARMIDWREEGGDRHPVVDGIGHWIDEAANRGALFSEVGAPWAFTGRDRVVARLDLHGESVAAYRDGSGTIASSSPRPYLHPVRTRAGVTVTAQHPADHDWHLGIGFAVQDVNGVNFWGGRTYVGDEGYVWRDDHGRIVGSEPMGQGDRLEQSLHWIGPDGSALLDELRTFAWRAVDNRAWMLTATFALTPAAAGAVVLQSPGSKGRPLGGYGGFFWRLPACSEAEVFTSEATGEQAVHGHSSDWIAWSARFTAAPGESGPATVVLAAADAVTARDPWFVRHADYPGVGSALAWDQATVIQPGETLTRSFRMLFADAVLSADECADYAERMRPTG